MRKAIGFVGSTTLLAAAVSLWLASGGEPSQSASAQTDGSGMPTESSQDSSQYKATAVRLLQEAQIRAQQGDTEAARMLAERAGTFPVRWDQNEQSPWDFVQSLDNRGEAVGNSTGEQTSPFALEDSGDSDPLDPVALSRMTPKEQANALLQSARVDLEAGNYEEARRKALQARQLKVPFSLFEERPEHLLAEVERKSSTVVLTADNAAPVPQPTQQQSPVIEPAAPPQQEVAQKLLREARLALAAGQLDTAREQAVQAQELEVTYGLFDDRPELVLREIQRSESQANFANANPPISDSPAENPVEATTNPAQDSRKQEVAALLAQARTDIKAGQMDLAREKAMAASKIPVAYDVFDDRPELVIAEIDRVIAASNVAQSPAQGSESDVEQAQQLLAQARKEMAAGQFENARDLASQAQQMQTSYRLFDDRPDLVLNDIQRAMSKQSIAVTDPTEQAAPGTPQTSTEDQMVAQQLLKQARADLAAGRLTEAQTKAEQVQQMQVSYSMFDDRPELVIEEITRKNRTADGLPTAGQTDLAVTIPDKPSSASPFDSVPQVNPLDPAGAELPVASGNRGPTDLTSEPAERGARSFEQATVVHPTGPAAIELYNQGLYHLRQGDRDAARTAFLEAYRSGQQLDLYRQQQLQDFLRELTPRNQRIQLVQNQVSQPSEVDPASPPGQLDLAAQQQALQYDRLRTEVLNAVFRAERLKETDSDQALEILDRVTANVENSGISGEAATTLLRHVRNAQASVASFQQQRAPVVELQRQNEETRQIIEQEQKAQIRIEQEFANLVEDYNDLFNQQRYAEAEVLAKQAKELDPDNPVAVTMVWKARFARRIARDEEIKDMKDESWVQTMQGVDESVINPVVNNPIAYPDAKSWKDLTDRRKKYGSDNRIRTEEEQRIDQSLSRQISLHFEATPLREVMKHISSVANINIVLDSLGLEDEGVATTDPVSIDVDGIRLKSALKLMLEPKKLAFTIEDDVLKVTSEIRQQGKLIPVTYPVADLVVPIASFAGNQAATNGFAATDHFGSAGSQYSVPTGGMQRSNGQAFFQVNDLGGGVDGFNPGNGLDSPDVNVGGGSSIDFDSLMDLIISTVQPDTWNEVGGGGTVRPFESTLSLVIRQTQQVHEEISDLLAQLRRLQDLQVTVEVRFIAVSDRFFERIGVDFDFNVQDSLGTPPELPPFGFPGASTNQNQQGQNGQAGGIGGGQGQGGQGGQGGQQGQQGQQGANGNFFEPFARRRPSRDDYPQGTVVGLSSPSQFTDDFDIQFQQGSFELGVPDFGNFNPDAGIQVGMAILSDIEAFFFIQAAQADERANLMFAPKVTLFNGQTAFVRSIVQRPFVISLTPTVGFFSVGFTPQVALIPEGVQLSVQAVISADRRYVRLSVQPNFTNITDVFTFSFISSGGGGGGGLGGGGGFGGGGGGLGGGGFGGGGFGGGGFGGGQGGFGFGGIGGFGGGGFGGGGQGGFGGGQGGFGGGQGGQQGQGAQGGAGSEVTVQQPVQEQVTVSTTVSVPDGGTVLLGGIKRLREGRNMAGVPILNKIPYVSRLFKNTGVGRETESVMMMVTPRIIIQEEEEELLGIPL